MTNYDDFLNAQFKMTDAGRIDKVIDLYTTYNPDVDLEAMKQGGYIDALARMMEPLLLNFDDHAPEVMAYWAKLGMVKEFHGETDAMNWKEFERKTGYYWDFNPEGRQNMFKKWTSFVPVSAFEKNRNKKYPVIFFLHGGFNPNSIIDGWGIVQEAAKREWIVIAPSLELDEVLEEILEQAKVLYPVDTSRVYAAGFSYGGFMSNFVGNKRPDLFAAVGPCGAPIGNGFVDKPIGPEPQTPFDGVSRAAAAGTYMPVINIYGNLDGHRFPFYDYQGFFADHGKGAKELIEGINHWARVNHAKEISFEDVMALKDRNDISEEEKYIGLPLEPDCRRTVIADGITNYVGDLKSEDGITRIRLMCEMNMPHWPTPEMSRQLLEFFSHFSRNTQTLESIYDDGEH